MNQRKRGRKCQPQSKWAPVTLALLALSFYLRFAPFPVLPSHHFLVVMRGQPRKW